MAKFNSTTFGFISGRHGSAVAALQKDGTNVLRVYRAPSNPNTDKQQVQRAKFGFVTKELNGLRNLFQATFGRARGKNDAVSYALKTAVTGEYPDYSLDYSQLIISIGDIDTTERVTVTRESSTSVRVDWDTTIGSESKEKDNVNLVFMNAVSKIALLKQGAALRSDGSVTIALPEVWANVSIHCWMYFSTEDGRMTSTSQYIGLLEPQVTL